jgi:hypothetical protein
MTKKLQFIKFEFVSNKIRLFRTLKNTNYEELLSMQATII